MGRILLVICLMLTLHGCASVPETPEWETHLTPEQRVRLEESRIQAAGMMMMGFNMGGGFNRYRQQCMTTHNGQMVYQQCY